MTFRSAEPSESRSERPSDVERRESDRSRISSAMKELRSAGWYWGALTANQANDLLQEASEGSFLLRDSAQTDFLFTISAMTAAGPTNLRVQFCDSRFQLDSVVLVRPKLQRFDSVVRLVEHYVRLSLACQRSTAAVASANGTVQLMLTKPVYVTTPSLQHLCRVAINRRTKEVQQLPIPSRLKEYLQQYSYCV